MVFIADVRRICSASRSCQTLGFSQPSASLALYIFLTWSGVRAVLLAANEPAVDFITMLPNRIPKTKMGRSAKAATH
jgi:hypothetical protein